MHFRLWESTQLWGLGPILAFLTFLFTCPPKTSVFCECHGCLADVLWKCTRRGHLLPHKAPLTKQLPFCECFLKTTINHLLSLGSLNTHVTVMSRIKRVYNLLDCVFHSVFNLLLAGIDHSLIHFMSVTGWFNAWGRKYLEVQFLAQEVLKLNHMRLMGLALKVWPMWGTMGIPKVGKSRGSWVCVWDTFVCNQMVWHWFTLHWDRFS